MAFEKEVPSWSVQLNMTEGSTLFQETPAQSGTALQTVGTVECRTIRKTSYTQEEMKRTAEPMTFQVSASQNKQKRHEPTYPY